MFENWEVSHIAYAVDDLETWMERYGQAIGGNWTSVLEYDLDWQTPKTGETRHVVARDAWLTGQTPPIELWDGPEGSPFHVPAGSHRFHHFGYWAEDMNTQVAQLQGIGYEVEHTPVLTPAAPATDGDFRGFVYLLHPDGIRVELHSASFKEGIRRWMNGGPRWLPDDVGLLSNDG
jgi:hypothetical protein